MYETRRTDQPLWCRSESEHLILTIERNVRNVSLLRHLVPLPIPLRPSLITFTTAAKYEGYADEGK